VLNALGGDGIRAKVGKPLMDKARRFSPSDLALAILYVVHDVDPAYLEKKVFPKFRKSMSPLDEWERHVTSQPLQVK